MSTPYEFKIGILILVDIVNFTQQANLLGDLKLKKFSEKVENQIVDISAKMGAHFIKSIGDAFLLFIEGIDLPKMKLFLEFVEELRDKSIQGIFDFEDFTSDLRCVAHFGNFQFKVKDEKIIDLQSVEGIKVFRIEKEADRYEVVITGQLFDLIKMTLKEKKIDHIQVGQKIFKGFSDQPTLLYKLIFPDKNLSSELLEHETMALDNKCQTIPVFGGLFSAISMGKNFINLSIKGGIKPDYHYTDIEKRRKIQETLEVEDKNNKFERMREHYTHVLSAEEMYETYKRGVIFGLPGAGKTTTLRYFAYRDFSANRDIPDKEKKRVIIFFYCFRACSYDNWLKMTKQKIEQDIEDIESILAYFVYHFLFGKKPHSMLTEKEIKEFYKAEKLVIKAYNQGRLTLLMDGLDECESCQIKENLITFYSRLFKDFIGTNNKIFLTSRYSEKEDFFADTNECIFDICSLDKEQLREMARYFYKDEPTLYKKFDNVVWKEEIAAKIGGTPITAILLLTYFREFQRLESRFNMYDVLIKFIFIKTWKQVKQTGYDGNIVKKFIKEATSGDVFKKNKDLLSLYDAVTLLAYDYTQLGEFTMTQASILNTFEQIAGDKEKSEMWFEDLVKENLLLHVGRSEHDEEYIFIHSTVMEYLAARFIIERINSTDISNLKKVFEKELPLEESLKKMEQRFFELETLPIAAGSSLDNGFLVLGLLRRVIQSYKSEAFKQAVYECAYKSLAEVERNICRELDRIRIPRQQGEIKDKIKKKQTDLHWIYTYLKLKVLTPTDEQLKKSMDFFKTISKLSLPTFLYDHLTYSAYSDGEYAIKALRLELLNNIINREILDDWLKSNEDKVVEKSLEKEKKQLEKADGSLLKFDSRVNNPEDKNFNYYHQNIGNFLEGFLGSPNLRHSGKVTCTAVLPDGKHLISGSSDKTIKCWELATGKEIKTFKGHNDRITSLVVTPDGKQIISSSDDKTLKLWNLSNGFVIRTFRGHKDIVNCVAITPDGKYFISASTDETLKLWDISSGEEIRTFKGHSDIINCVFINPDGKSMVSGSWDYTLKLWDLTTGKEIRTFKGHNHIVSSVSITPDGKYVVSGSWDHTLKLWDLSTGNEIQTLNGHKSYVTNVIVTPDQEHIISCSYDETIKIWSFPRREEIRTLEGHNDSVTSVSITPNKKLIISGAEDETIKIWDFFSGKDIRVFKGHTRFVTGVSFSSDGSFLSSGSKDETIKYWDLSSGKEVRTFKGHSNKVTSVTITPNGKYILSGSADHTLRLWDIDSGKEIRALKGHNDTVTCVSVTPDGRYILSGSGDETLKCWDITSGKELISLRSPDHIITTFSTTPDGKFIITGSSDKTLKLWDLSSGKEIRTFTGHKDRITCISVTPDGSYILSGSFDKTIKLWELSSGVEIISCEGHNDIITCVSVTLDGNHILSGSPDMALKIWDIRDASCIETLDLLWIPNVIKPVPGKPYWFATANRNGTITFFDLRRILGRGVYEYAQKRK